MDVSRISQGEKIAAVGGILLFIFLFLPWFGDISGWEGQSSTDVYMLITAVVAVAAALMPGNETGYPGSHAHGGRRPAGDRGAGAGAVAADLRLPRR